MHSVGHSLRCRVCYRAICRKRVTCQYLSHSLKVIIPSRLLSADLIKEICASYVVSVASPLACPRRIPASVTTKLAGTHCECPAAAKIASSSCIKYQFGLMHCGWLLATVSLRRSSGFWAGSRELDAKLLHHRRIARIYLAARAATCSMHHLCLLTSQNPLSL